MSLLGAFPLLFLIVIAYNIVVFAGGAGPEVFQEVVFNLPMASGDPWEMTLGGLFVIVGLFLLFIELIKATDTHGSSQLNHAFSLGVFIICLIEFIIVKGFGNDTFFMILLMTLMDVVAGYTVTIRAARRDFGVGEGVFGGS